MKSLWLIFFYFALFLTLHPLPLFAQNKTEKKPVKKPAVQSTDGVSIQFEEPQKDAPNQYIESIEKIFKNPVLASGLASGTDALNRSLDSLMESVFYSLMDNDFKYPITDEVSFNIGLQRDVYDASVHGTYVIVDQFKLGPQFAKEIGQIKDVPVNLGSQTGVSFLDIYLRSDPMRVLDKTEHSFLRYMVNQWFGILPILEALLPPSFNANEMYDPLHRLEVPFILPITVEKAREMPSGSIRSYLTSGGIQLGMDWAMFKKEQVATLIQRINSLNLTLPYTVFIQGEHRINVLKKSPSIFWVSVQDSGSVGHGVQGILGNTFFLLQNTIRFWKGVPVNVFPVDIGIEKSFTKLFGKVYEFDLSNPNSHSAYLAAVKGDFAAAYTKHLERTEKKIDSGVSYLFTKKESRFDLSTRKSRNLALLSKENLQSDFSSNVEITDPTGMFYILESGGKWEHTWSDALTGKQEEKGENIGDIKVVKIPDEKRAENNDKEFRMVVGDNPYFATLTYSINDKYVESEDFENYISKLRKLMQLPLNEIKEIPIRDEDAMQSRARKAFFKRDSNTSQPLLHVTPTYLGRLRADSAMLLTSEHFDKICKRSSSEKWRAFAQSFGGDQNTWKEPEFYGDFLPQLTVLGSLMVYPVRWVFNDLTRLDRIRVTNEVIKALDTFAATSDPEAKRAEFKKILRPDYPLEIAEALLTLADPKTVARSVLFSVDPKGYQSPKSRAIFEKLNQLKIVSTTRKTKIERYESIRAKESEFIPQNLKFMVQKPFISKLKLNKSPDDASTLNLTIFGKGLQHDKPVHVFIRFEQSGKLKLGKLKLAEIIVPLTPHESEEASITTQVISVFLTGKNSPINGFLVEQALKFGGEFRVALAISQDKIVWSDEKDFRFRYDQEKLLPTE